MPAAKRASKAALRIFMAHGLAYPIATAWAFGSVPLCVMNVAAEVGITLDDETVAHRVLLRVAWPTIGSFVLVHLAGVVWAFDRNEDRGLRMFRATLAGLFAIPVVVGGISWIWLMTR
jgi:ABC-type sugar transport system permease subunit